MRCRGAILIFHQVHENPADELMTGSSAAFLDYVLGCLVRNGWDLVPLAEALRRLASPHRSRRFAAITFDDGYRDTATIALPILERHNAPFTVYVPTGALTREMDSWWLGLRRLLLLQGTFEMPEMGRAFDCANLQSKISAMREISHWVHLDYSRAAMLTGLLQKAGVSLQAMNETSFLGPEDLRALALHPLATIGAHGESHAALATLTLGQASNEMIRNRDFLENLLQRPVEHLAYPYGGPTACGAREASLAAELGFASAVATVHGPLLASDCGRLHLLPRLGVAADETPEKFDVRISGGQRAVAAATSWIPRE
jgi:peptidoglycan/xylan/chitin deacetylase (PgdA/CDA1 family)